MKIYILILSILIGNILSAQMKSLDKTSYQLKTLLQNYTLETVRMQDGTKCINYTDNSTSLEFALFFDQNTDRCNLVVVTPPDKINERALFMLLDENWKGINANKWTGNYEGLFITVKAIKDEKTGLSSFYYSIN